MGIIVTIFAVFLLLLAIARCIETKSFAPLASTVVFMVIVYVIAHFLVKYW